MKKYDLIFLPPDQCHLTLFDTYSFNLNLVNLLLAKISDQFDNILVLYRNKAQQVQFPVNFDFVVNKKFTSYIKFETLIVGPPNSLLLEALSKNIPYYLYDNFSVHAKYNQSIYCKLDKYMYIAKNPDNLIFNIKYKKIFKRNYSFASIVSDSGFFLDEIVQKIKNETN